jgi:hypothetical protein
MAIVEGFLMNGAAPASRKGKTAPMNSATNSSLGCEPVNVTAPAPVETVVADVLEIWAVVDGADEVGVVDDVVTVFSSTKRMYPDVGSILALKLM